MVSATFVALLLAVLLCRADGAPPSPDDASCARQSALAGPCFNLHGRLSLYNGTPSARIWRIGSTRILGVSDSRCVAPTCRQMPEELRSLLRWDTAIFGDFLVCPFTLSKPAHMQFVCVESAKNLTIREQT